MSRKKRKPKNHDTAVGVHKDMVQLLRPMRLNRAGAQVDTPLDQDGLGEARDPGFKDLDSRSQIGIIRRVALANRRYIHQWARRVVIGYLILASFVAFSLYQQETQARHRDHAACVALNERLLKIRTAFLGQLEPTKPAAGASQALVNQVETANRRKVLERRVVLELTPIESCR